MASALEQSFADICEKHGLLNMGVTYHRPQYAHDKPHFAVCVQWLDEGEDLGCGCSIEHGDTVAAAIGKAIACMLAERSKAIAFADEPLPVEA